MVSLTLTVSAATSVLTGVLYFYVADRLGDRQVTGGAALAHTLFIMWWRVLGAVSILGAAQLVLYMAGWLPLPVYSAITSTSLLLIVIGLWGLLYYLWFLYTGSASAWKPLASAYVVFYGVLAGLLAWVGPPQALGDDGWGIIQVPEPELPFYVRILFLVGLVGPQLVAAGAYLRLYGKAETRTQRYRITMVSGAILGWFGASVVAAAVQISDTVWWPMVSSVISILAALAVLFAYRPPRWLQDRYGVTAVAAPSPETDPAHGATGSAEEE